MDMRSNKQTMLNRVRFLETKLAQQPTKYERIYMQCLDMALQHCNNWTIGKKKVNDADGYCQLAKVFADNSISKI